MKPATLLMLLLAPVGAGCLSLTDPAAELPDGKDGGVWRYEGRTPGGRAYEKETRVVDVPGPTVVLVSVRRGAGDDGATRLELDERTLALRALTTSAGRMTFDPPYNVLSPSADHTYRGTIRVAGLEQAAQAKVDHRGLERVSVPAGDYTAHHFVSEMRVGGALGYTQVTELWYVPELKASVKTIVDGETEELASFER